MQKNDFIPDNSLYSIIDDYGHFITQMEENHRKENVQENIFPSKSMIKRNYEIKNIKFEEAHSYPFKILMKEEIQNFIESGVLKTIDHRGLKQTFYEFIFHEKLDELIEMLFWLFLIIKYPFITGDEDSYSRILKELRKKISNNYVTFIIILPQNQKENLLNLIIFSIGYILIMIFCKHFPNEKVDITNRFLLDVFHIVLFELNGVCVSDYYVQNMVEKNFTYKFLSFYKDYGSFEKVETFSRKPNLFLGKSIVFPEFSYGNSDMTSFSHELSSILYKNSNGLKKSKTFVKNNIDSLSKKTTIYRSIDSRKQNDISEFSSTNRNNSKFFTHNSISEENNYINKMKFNCYQISPTISNVLENGKMTLPHIQKKVINHPLDKSIEKIIFKKPLNNSNILEKNYSSYKKKNKVSVLDSYNYSTNELTSDYKSNSKYLKDIYEMKFVLDQNQQNTQHLPSSKKLFENHEIEKKKSENDYLLTKGYSAFCIESLNKMREKENEKKFFDSLPNEININSYLDIKDQSEIFENSFSPKNSPRKGRRNARLSFKMNSIPNISEKPEEKPKPYEITPIRNFNAIILEKNTDLEDEKDRERDENLKLENWLANEKNSKMVNYMDKRKKYKEEHSSLIKGNIDSNINNLVINIIQKKEASMKNLIKIVKGKKNKKK